MPVKPSTYSISSKRGHITALWKRIVWIFDLFIPIVSQECSTGISQILQLNIYTTDKNKINEVKWNLAWGFRLMQCLNTRGQYTNAHISDYKLWMSHRHVMCNGLIFIELRHGKSPYKMCQVGFFFIVAMLRIHAHTNNCKIHQWSLAVQQRFTCSWISATTPDIEMGDCCLAVNYGMINYKSSRDGVLGPILYEIVLYSK